MKNNNPRNFKPNLEPLENRDLPNGTPLFDAMPMIQPAADAVRHDMVHQMQINYQGTNIDRTYQEHAFPISVDARDAAFAEMARDGKTALYEERRPELDIKEVMRRLKPLTSKLGLKSAVNYLNGFIDFQQLQREGADMLDTDYLQALKKCLGGKQMIGTEDCLDVFCR